MVNDPFEQPPDRALALGYAPAERRAGVAALFALDATLGRILRTTREPLVGRMRLTWWFEALERLDGAPPPAEPVLAALARDVLPRGVSGAALAAMVDGWEPLLDGDEEALEAHARERGGRLFRAAATVLGAGDARAEGAGEGWALADLAVNLSRPQAAARARAMAAERLDAARGRWSRAGRTLGALALLARLELEGAAPAVRLGRLLALRLTGR